jgi:hypothetical protein
MVAPALLAGVFPLSGGHSQDDGIQRFCVPGLGCADVDIHVKL